MNFMDRLPRPKAMTNYGPTDDRSYFPGGSYYGGVDLAGLPLTSEGAMRQMTVNNCVRVLYNCISQMPCQLMEEVDDVKNKAKEHYLYKIIGKRPNSWMTSPQFFGMAIVHICLRGNFYAYKARVGNKITALLPLHPDRVQVSQNDDWSLTYKVSGSKGQKDYAQEDIFHIRGLSLDGIVGINPIEYARQCVFNGQSSETFIGNYFSKGMHPGAIITHPYTQTTQNYLNQLEALKIKYAGLNNAQDVMLLEKDTTITFPEIKLVDQQFIEQQRFTESQIAGMYGVPLILIQAGSTPATFASSAQFKQSFVDFTIAPIAVNMETSIDRDLLTDVEQDTLYSKFNMGGLLRGNMAERFAAYQIGIVNKFMNSNEVRSLEDWNPREGGEAYENPNTSVSQNDPGKAADQGGGK
jgi:HK97 family phage portal protein